MSPVEDATKTLHIAGTVAGEKKIYSINTAQQTAILDSPIQSAYGASNSIEEEGYCANLSCLRSALTAPLMPTSL